jgi:hypothetical protein
MFAIKIMISKISITNEKITAYFKYELVTKRRCDFDIEIARIKRDVLMNLWKKSIKKIEAHSEN